MMQEIALSPVSKTIDIDILSIMRTTGFVFCQFTNTKWQGATLISCGLEENIFHHLRLDNLLIKLEYFN